MRAQPRQPDEFEKTLKVEIAKRERIDEEKAEEIAKKKSQSVKQGMRFIYMGVATAVFGLVLPGVCTLITREAPGIPVLVFAAPFILVGLAIAVRGASTASGEALDVRKEMGGVGGLIAGLIRGNGGTK